MNLLTIDSVSKGFGLKPLLDNISFGLEDDEKMGIIGTNGSGKTTLLRIIAGQEAPDGGKVTFASGRKVSLLPQNPVFDPEQTVLDAVFEHAGDAMRVLRDYEAAVHSLNSDPSNEVFQSRLHDLAHKLDVTGGWELEANAEAVLSRLGITDTAARIGTLSGGQRKRVALARALVLRPDLLILDEPTNHLDSDTIAWLELYLERYTGAMLLVTHDRYFLDRVTNRMLEIADGHVQRYEGNYTTYLEKKEELAVLHEAELQRRDNLMRRELAWLRRGARARATKQKAHVERARALVEAPQEQEARKIELSGITTRLGKKVVELENVSKRFDERVLIDAFSYKFTRGEKIGIIGPNGSGKTTLLEIIAERLAPDTGTVERGPTAVIGYYDQESRALADELRVIDYIKEVAEQIRMADGSVITASQMLDRFLFAPAVQFTPVGKLSGGERRRLYLLRILMTSPNLLLLDEPTNDLDIPTLIALEDYLDSFPGCLVVVSHDRYFLDRTVDHLLRLDGDGGMREYPGNYSAFLDIQAREEADKPRDKQPAKTTAGQAQAGEAPESDAAPRKLSFKERKELESLETRIDAAEKRKSELQSLMAGAGADYEALASYNAELGQMEAQLSADVERWAELAERSGD